MGLRVTETPHPATCWTSCYRSRRTPTLGPDQPPLAPWAQGQAPDQAQDWAQAATAVVHLVERLAAEQVSRETPKPDNVNFYLCYFVLTLVSGKLV